MRSTARALGDHFAAVNYDPRGRGASGDTLPYAIDREIEEPDDESSQGEARQFADGIRNLLAEDKRAEALDTFYRGTGMPDEMIEGIRETPTWPGSCST